MKGIRTARSSRVRHSDTSWPMRREGRRSHSLAASRDDAICGSVPVGQGQAALKYLAPYIFRVALSNRRIVKFENGKVTFRFRKSDTGQWRSCTLDVLEFLRRFLQHVLPKGFVKVRYYGLFAPCKRSQLALCRQQLSPTTPTSETDHPTTASASYRPLCANCQQPLRLVQTLRPRSRCPP